MARHYRCTVCGYQKETQAMRGPVPLKCDDCKKLEPPKSTQSAVTVRKPNRASIESMEKITRALEMRRDYKTWEQIAQECGFSSREAAFASCKQEMARRQETLNETIDDFRETSLARLESVAAAALEVLEADHLIVNSGAVVVHPRTGEFIRDNGPKLAAIDRLVKINESARKLLGADAATKTEAQVNVNYTVKGIVESDMP